MKSVYEGAPMGHPHVIRICLNYERYEIETLFTENLCLL